MFVFMNLHSGGGGAYSYFSNPRTDKKLEKFMKSKFGNDTSDPNCRATKQQRSAMALLPMWITVYFFMVLIVFQICKLIVAGVIIAAELDFVGCDDYGCDSVLRDPTHAALVFQCLFNFMISSLNLCLGAIMFLTYDTTCILKVEIKMKYFACAFVFQILLFAIGFILMPDFSICIIWVVMIVLFIECLAVCISFYLPDAAIRKYEREVAAAVAHKEKEFEI